MYTIGPALDHKRSARLTYVDNPSVDLAKLQDTWAAAKHTTRKAETSFWDDICLSVQNCNDSGDIAVMHVALKHAMSPIPHLTAPHQLWRKHLHNGSLLFKRNHTKLTQLKKPSSLVCIGHLLGHKGQ